MRNLKRVLSLALAVVMVLGMMAITTSAADYADADEITNIEAVEVLSALGIVGGDGTNFNPNGNFTREAAAKLITYMKLGPDMAEKLAGTDVFTDVAADRWSAKYIGYCANLGYITGVSNDKFNPSGVLKDIELGKLVLCALGKDPAKYTGSNWASAVTVDMIETGLVDSVTGTAISREDACAMILAGLKHSDTPDPYNVINTQNNNKVIANFEDPLDAVLYTTVLNTNGNTRYSYENAPATDSLLKTVYKVDYKDVNVVDAYGRPAVSYTDGKKLELFYAEEADYTITLTKDYTTLSALVDDVIKATGVKKMNADIALNNGQTVLDGKTIATLSDVENALTASAKAGTTLELYVAEDGKTVEKIIAVGTYAGVAAFTKVNAKTEEAAYITVDGIKYETEDFADKDVVLYTKAWNGKDYEIQTIEKAESVTGKLTSYNNKKEYTIGGETYKMSSSPVSGFAHKNVTDQINKEYVYFLDADNKIVYGTTPAGEAPVIITDYAVITTAKAKEVNDGALIGANTTLIAQVEAILSDSTKGVFDLDVTKENGKFYVEVDGKDKEITENLKADDLKGVYGYTLDGTTITLAQKLAAFDGKEAEDTVVYRSTKSAAKAATTIETYGGTVIANSETIFVLPKDKGYEVKTGIASMENTTIPSDSAVVVDVKYNEKGNTNVAVVVFAIGATFEGADAVVTTDSYIYIDGTYSVTVNEKEKTTYTYTGVKADDSTIEVTGEANLKAGIYEYNTKGEIVKTNANTNAVKVGTVAGTTYQLGSDYLTVNDTTKVVVVTEGAALEKGAEVYYLNGKAAVSLIYVTKAAE